jgi:hypothetical protein
MLIRGRGGACKFATPFDHTGNDGGCGSPAAAFLGLLTRRQFAGQRGAAESTTALTQWLHGGTASRTVESVASPFGAQARTQGSNRGRHWRDGSLSARKPHARHPRHQRGAAVRADIAAGGTFPDYELTDHTKMRRRLSDLQGNDPMILVLARGHYCPKDQQQHRQLAAFQPEVAVAYNRHRHRLHRQYRRDPRVPGLGRSQLDLPVGRRPQDPEGSRHPGVHGPLPRPDGAAHVRAQAEARHLQRLQRLLVLGPTVH